MSYSTSIDILMEEVKNSIILLIGESGTAKDTIAHRFIKDGLDKEGSILVVLLAQTPKEYLIQLEKVCGEKMVKKYQEEKKIQFLDVFSFRSPSKEPLKGVEMIDNVNDLLTLSVKINEISSRRGKLRIVFDKFSLLMLYNEPMQVLNFVQSLSARIRQRDQSVLLVIDSGVIEKKVERTLQSIVDIMVETRRHDTKEKTHQLVRVKFAKYEHENRWVEVV